MATKTLSVTNWSPLIFVFFVCIARVIAFLDIDEINSVHYGIEILKEPILLPKESIPQSVQLKSKFGQQYQCSFPDHNEQEKLNEEVEKVAMEAGIPELLRPLGKRPCLFKTKDWWSYEFCYGRYIRQYHMEDQKPVGDIIYLGYFESEYNWENSTEEEIVLRKKHEQSRYHSQNYVNGTKCDLNGEGRKTEVRFICEEDNGDSISQIDEPETCVYVLTVYTATICHHPYLKAPTPSKPISITCNPVLSQEQYNAYLEHVQSEKTQKMQEKEKLQDSVVSELPVKEKDMSESLKIHLTSSPEEAASLFKEMLSAYSYDKQVGKSLFTDDDVSIKKGQLLVSPLDHEDEKEESRTDSETDDGMKKMDNVATESSIITTETSNASPTLNDVDDQNQNDVIDDDFSGELKEIAEAKEHFVSTKEKLQSVLQAQFKDLVTEAEDVLLEDQPDQRVNQLAATKKLANTLKLLNKLEKTEKELKIVDKAIEEHRKAFEKSKLTSKQMSSSIPNSVKSSQSDDDNSEDEKEKETDSTTTKNLIETDLPIKEAETRIKVRVTKIKSGGGGGGGVSGGSNVERELPAKERQKLEESVKEGLEKAGLESVGDKIQVRIITAGYYDNDDDTLKILSEEDTAAFKNMIVAILGGNDESSKETERYKQLEENYSFVWQNGKQIKKPSPK